MLIVTSKVKKLIKDSEMNTSAAAVEALSKHVEAIVALAVGIAKADGRKTVMDRDIVQVAYSPAITTSST